MNYKTIKMEYHHKKDRFSRLIMVREDINLIELGCAMCTAVRTAFEHNFQFIKGKKFYSPDCFMEYAPDDGLDERPMKNYSLKDLGDSFQFLYDTGDDWRFDCKVYKKDTKVTGEAIAYLLDGKGQGVWEDNVWTLSEYFDGRVDPDSNKEDSDKGIYKPWNFEIDKYSDFDTKFDLVKEKEYFNDNLNENISMYLDSCHLSGYELEVNPRDIDVDTSFKEEDGSINMNLNTTILKVVDEQIKTVDYVKKKYKELLTKYDDKTSRDMIARVLVEEIHDSLTMGAYNEKEYIKKIKNIK